MVTGWSGRASASPPGPVGVVEVLPLPPAVGEVVPQAASSPGTERLAVAVAARRMNVRRVVPPEPRFPGLIGSDVTVGSSLAPRGAGAVTAELVSKLGLRERQAAVDHPLGGHV